MQTNTSSPIPPTVAVMAATSRIGQRITRQLLAAGINVRALGRSPEKLAKFSQAGAETFVGDATDAAFLTKAFCGADAVYTLLPYDPMETDYYAQQNTVGEATVRAIQDSGIRRVIYLSSVGGDLPAGTGMIVSMHEQEERLRKLAGVDVLVLRPGPFFENLMGFVEMIRHEGITGDAFDPDLPLPMISTRDIASAAADALLARDWTGFQVRELLGQRDLTFAEVTRIIGAGIRRPHLQYVQFPYEDAAQALAQFGFSSEIAQLEVEVAKAANERMLVSREGRHAGNTTSTSIEEFAEEFAQAYFASTAAAS